MKYAHRRTMQILESRLVMIADHSTFLSGKRRSAVRLFCPSRDGGRSALSSIVQNEPNFPTPLHCANALFERTLRAMKPAEPRQKRTQSNPIRRTSRHTHDTPNKANWVRPEGRRQTTEGRGQKTANRRQRADDGRQKTEDRRRNTHDAIHNTNPEPRDPSGGLTRRGRAVYWRDVLVWQLL